MENTIDEIAPDVFRLSTWVDEIAPPAGFTFNHEELSVPNTRRVVIVHRAGTAPTHRWNVVAIGRIDQLGDRGDVRIGGGPQHRHRVLSGAGRGRLLE